MIERWVAPQREDNQSRLLVTYDNGLVYIECVYTWGTEHWRGLSLADCPDAKNVPANGWRKVA